MAGGYGTESARRALPSNGSNYSQLVEEGRGEVRIGICKLLKQFKQVNSWHRWEGEAMNMIQYKFCTKLSIFLIDQFMAQVEEYRQAKLFRLRFRHLALITVRLVNYIGVSFTLFYFVLTFDLSMLYINHFALSTYGGRQIRDQVDQ